LLFSPLSPEGVQKPTLLVTLQEGWRQSGIRVTKNKGNKILEIDNKIFTDINQVLITY
jgi:hypothetical protein